MNEIAVCCRCGEPDDAENMVNGVCPECMEHKPLDFDELYTMMDKAIGDCV
jgi:hypothetical protein